MAKLIDLTGHRFGRLVVVKRAEDAVFPGGGTKVKWECLCDCGNKSVVLAAGLRGKRGAKSCGCYMRECQAVGNFPRLSGEERNKRRLPRLCKICNEIKTPSEFQKGYVNVCKPCAWTSTKLRGYNLTREQFATFVNIQNGMCAICDGPPSGKDKVLFIDHDHATGKVRGLLCRFCNCGIGMFSDSQDRLRRAALYLDERGAP